MKLTFVAHDIGSKEMGMGYRPYMFAKLSKARGHKVDLITSAYSHVRNKNPQQNSWYFQQTIEELPYHFLGALFLKSTMTARALNMIYFSLKLWLLAPRFAKDLQPDVVIASSPHPLIIFGARRLAQKSRAKLIFEVRDIWPLSVVKTSHVKPSHPFVKLLQFAEDYAYRHSDSVISLLSNAYPHMQSRGLNQKKYYFLPNGCNVEDIEKFSPLNKATQDKIDEFKKRFRVTVGYAGAHGIMNQLDHLITAAQMRPKVGFLLLGSGPEKVPLIAQVSQLKLDNILFLDPVNKNEVGAFLKTIDIAYIGLKDSELFHYGISPNKLIDYMAYEKPVLMAIQTSGDPVEASGCGVKCESSSPEGIVKGLDQMLEFSDQERVQMGQSGRTWLKENLDYKKIMNQFESVIAR